MFWKRKLNCNAVNLKNILTKKMDPTCKKQGPFFFACGDWILPQCCQLKGLKINDLYPPPVHGVVNARPPPFVLSIFA